MSRYDWGGANPAIEKLKDCAGPARQKAISHPLCRQLARVRLRDGIGGKILERSRSSQGQE
jgi:hypothetical protein